MQHGAAVELLARVPVFHGLGGELLGVILQRGTIAHLRAGQTIAEAGVPAEAALFVLEGTARLQDASGRDLEPVAGPGTILCDMAMLIETSHIHGAVARSAVTLLGLPRDAIGQLMVAEPGLAAHFADNIRRNLAATAETLHRLDSLLAEPIDEGPYLDDGVQGDATDRPAAALQMAPEQPAGDTGGAAKGGVNGGVNDGVNDGVNRFGPDDAGPPVPEFLRRPAAVASHFSALADRSMNETRPKVPVHDLLAELNGANGAANQIRPAPERDRMAAPSPAPRQPPAATRRPSSAPASPIHGQAAGHG